MPFPNSKDNNQTDAPNARRTFRLPVLRLLGLAAGIGILLVLIGRAGFSSFFTILRQTSPLLLTLALASYSLAWCARTWRLNIFVKQAGGRVRAWELFKLHISAYALNSILPAKLGDAAMVVSLKRRGIALGRAIAVVLQIRILDLFACILLSIPGVFLLFGRDIPERIWMTLCICTALVILPVAWVVMDRRNVLNKLAVRLKNGIRATIIRTAIDKAMDSYNGYREIVADARMFATSTGISLLAWAMEGATCCAIAAAVGVRMEPLPIMLAVAVANIGKIVPVTPGSVGIYESILAGVLALAGVDFSLAVAVAILDSMLKRLFNLAVGLMVTDFGDDLQMMIRQTRVALATGRMNQFTGGAVLPSSSADSRIGQCEGDRAHLGAE